MKPLRHLCLFMILYFFSTNLVSQIYLEEGFENNMPPGWEEIDVSNGGSWEFKTGGKTIEGENYPGSSFEGSLNALFSYVEKRVTKLVTPELDLSEAVKAELQFAHAMFPWGTDKDELRVYYSEHPDSSWKLLKHYTTETYRWIERTLQLPDSSYSAQYRVAFEGISQGGAGVCIDGIEIVENGVIPKKVESIEFHQASQRYIPSGSDNNSILRIDFEVSGNSGDLYLDSLTVRSLNTDDADLKENGVKLYATDDTVFSKENIVGQAANFKGQTAIFDNLHYSFSYGITSIWVTYDVKKNIHHTSHQNILDAKIESNAIKINNQTYPYDDKSPAGERILFESLIYEDFEKEINWSLGGEFQVDTPQGLGSTGNYGWYSPDPDSNAVSGLKILGTDLDSLGANSGDYEPSIGENAYFAVSPSVNCKYYQNVSVNYHQWLNIEMLDHASIDLVKNQQDTSEIWSNAKSYNDDQWVSRRIDASDLATRNSDVKMIFFLGPTNSSGNYGGWNIDDFSITGDFIAKDVGVSEWLSPVEGCALSDRETIEVVVKNYGALDFTEPIPIAFSLDGGSTFAKDTIYQNIPLNDSIIFTFTPKGDFSDGGAYHILAETMVEDDEDSQNDRFSGQIFAYPNEHLPYSTNFEQNDGYWRSLGKNKSWEYGIPEGEYIDSAASGEHVWMTNLDGPYTVNDSSFLESPCFDFTDVIKPIIELKICGDVEDHTDGMKLQYSYDGKVWHDVDSATHSSWNWYNSDPLALNAPAWSHNSAEWRIVRQFLPETLTNFSSVKLRLLFKSDGFASGDDGYAIDDISIYEAPIDVGVEDIVMPVTQCYLSDSQQVKLAIKNYGVRPVPANEEIQLKLEFDGDITIADTFRLPDELNVGKNMNYTLSQTVNMSRAGDYELSAFTTMEKNPGFYGNSANDTIHRTVSVLGMPNYDLGPSIGTEQPDTLILDAGGGYDSYQWHDGGPLTRTYDIGSEGTYKVTVTNSDGCSATDSIIVLPSNTDIGVVDVKNLSSACEYPLLHSIEIGVKNFGVYDKYTDDELPVGYSVNGNKTVLDTISLDKTLPVGDTTYFTFNSVDLTETKVYHFKLFTGYDGDINRNNDTLTSQIEVYGDPQVDLGADTLFTKRADTVTLKAGPGYKSYLWQDNSTGSTFDIQSKANKLYKVTVNDIHNCGQASDSVQIIADDFSVNKLTYPGNSCELSNQEHPAIKIKNNSQNTYSSNITLYAGYKIAGTDESFNIDTIRLSDDLLPGNAFIYQFDEAIDLSSQGVYDLKTFVSFNPDVLKDNDTLRHSVHVYGQPKVDLGPDTIYTDRPDTLAFNAGGEFMEYQWQNGLNDSVFDVSANQSNKYSIEVTAYHGCGTASDSVFVIANDLAVDELMTPESKCSHSQSEYVKVTIHNEGNDTLAPGRNISIGYVVDNQQPVVEVFELKDSLFPGKSVHYEFDKTADFSVAERNNIKIFINNKDANKQNNTLNEQVFTFGFPGLSFDADTVFSTEPDTLQFTVESGYSDYEWQDGSRSDTFNVSKSTSDEYSVTITDANGCSTSDTVFVSAYDLGIVDVTDPNSACNLSRDETIKAIIKNFAADTILQGETIPVFYTIDNQSAVNESVTLQEPLYPDSTYHFVFNQSVDFSEKRSYQVNVFTKLSGDARPNNDNFKSEIDVYGPELELGPDTTVQSPAYEIDAGPGFSSYTWHDGSEEQTFTADVHDDNNLYRVTVTNDFNCSVSDSVYIWFDVYPDLEVTEIQQPKSGCKQDKPLSVVVKITNVGNLELPGGTNARLGYRLNQKTMFTETLQLSSELSSQNSLEYEFGESVFMDKDKVYKLMVFANTESDENSINDTLIKEIDIHNPNPQVAGKDTIFLAKEELPYNLAVGAHYADVIWQDGSTKNSIKVTEFGEYWVQVTDTYGCSGGDTVIISENQEVSVGPVKTDEYELHVYPNPAIKRMHIKIKAKRLVEFHISLISLEGDVSQVKEIKMKGADIISLPVNGHSPGYYQLRVQTNQNYHVIPVIIQ